MVFGKLDIHMQTMKLDPCLTLFIKINSKRMKVSNVRPKTVKLLKENVGENPDKYFLLYDTKKAQATKEN